MILISYEYTQGQLKTGSSVTAHIQDVVSSFISVRTNAVFLYTTDRHVI